MRKAHPDLYYASTVDEVGNENKGDAPITTKGIFENDVALLTESHNDETTSIMVQTSTKIEPIVDSSMSTASPYYLQASDECSLGTMEGVEASSLGAPTGRQRIYAFSSLRAHERTEHPEFFLQECEYHPMAVTLESQMEEMAEYEMKHGCNTRMMVRDLGLSVDQVKYRRTLTTYKVILNMLNNKKSAELTEPLPEAEPVSISPSAPVFNEQNSISSASDPHSEISVVTSIEEPVLIENSQSKPYTTEATVGSHSPCDYDTGRPPDSLLSSSAAVPFTVEQLPELVKELSFAASVDKGQSRSSSPGFHNCKILGSWWMDAPLVTYLPSILTSWKRWPL